MALQIDHGSTGVILLVPYSVAGLTKDSGGLKFVITWSNGSTASTIIVTGANIEAIAAIGTYQAPSTASRVRFGAKDETNEPRLYELHLHNDRFGVADATQLTITATGAGLYAGGERVVIDLKRHSVNVTGWKGSTPNDLQSGRLDSHVGEIAAGVITTLTTAVEAAMLNESDGQQLLAAIQLRVQQLFDAGADVPVATLIELIAARIITDHGAGLYTRNTEPDNAGITSIDGKLSAPRLEKIDNLLAAGTYVAVADLTAAFTEIKGAGWASGTDTLEKIRDAITTGTGNVNVVSVNGIPITLGDLRFTYLSSSPVVGGLVTIVPGNGYNLAGGNQIQFQHPSWTNLADVETVDLSLVWHPDRPDRTVILNRFAGVIDVPGNRVYFQPSEAVTNALWSYRTQNPEDCCFGVDFVMKAGAGGKRQTRVHGPAVIVDPIIQP